MLARLVELSYVHTIMWILSGWHDLGIFIFVGVTLQCLSGNLRTSQLTRVTSVLIQTIQKNKINHV